MNVCVKEMEVSGTRELSGVPSYKGTNHLPKTPPPATITLGIRLHPMNLGGTQTFSL